MSVESIYDNRGTEVGRYVLSNKRIFLIIIDPEYRRQGYATRVISELYSSRTILGPSDSVVSPYVVRIWSKLKFYTPLHIEESVYIQHKTIFDNARKELINKYMEEV